MRSITLKVLLPTVLALGSFAAEIARAQSPPVERVQVLHITIRPDGITPATATLVPGRVYIAVAVRNLIAELPLRLERQTGEILHSVTLARTRGRWRHIIRLPAGDYVLRVPGVSRWTTQITVREPQ